ncbi:sigma-54-dependent transcriptional regulator [Pararhodonellum marinum]|uniref:sigma-54-dependent transcriptional regulator n=1 Tax=Pararhodonellum marinum TaxID=2755358 RepID=UPI00188F6656|nr:sigma-54 dependent transcriptional regulator [Pararhodonellum marinum]
MKNILIIDNQISICNLLNKFLTKNNYDVETTSNAIHALEILREKHFDLTIIEYHLPDISGIKILDRIQKICPKTEVIFMSSQVTLKNAVCVIQKGALNFISKPLNPDELLEAIKSSTGKSGPKEVNEAVPKEELNVLDPITDLGLIFGQCRKTTEMLNKIKRVGDTKYSVIIQGETGTGKESIARLLHAYSPRKVMPFIAVDCGSLSKEIAGSELFGHEKGAFTGAISQKVGFFEQANGGTIFLDEIANLSLDIQMALLRALQEKVIRRIGGDKEIPTDVRVITATNENLLEKSKNSFFREDLYFRLSEYVLKVPALRERKSELPLFIDFFLKQTSEELKSPKLKLSMEVEARLQEYHWPGNLRELKNVIRGMCLFPGEDNLIQKETLPDHILQSIHGIQKNQSLQVNGKEVQELFPSFDEYDLRSTALKAEYSRIIEVMKKVHFNKTKAAQILNIHRKTLYSKLKLMNIPY